MIQRALLTSCCVQEYERAASPPWSSWQDVSLQQNFPEMPGSPQSTGDWEVLNGASSSSHGSSSRCAAMQARNPLLQTRCIRHLGQRVFSLTEHSLFAACLLPVVQPASHTTVQTTVGHVTFCVRNPTSMCRFMHAEDEDDLKASTADVPQLHCFTLVLYTAKWALIRQSLVHWSIHGSL